MEGGRETQRERAGECGMRVVCVCVGGGGGGGGMDRRKWQEEIRLKEYFLTEIGL